MIIIVTVMGMDTIIVIAARAIATLTAVKMVASCVKRKQMKPSIEQDIEIERIHTETRKNHHNRRHMMIPTEWEADVMRMNIIKCVRELVILIYSNESKESGQKWQRSNSSDLMSENGNVVTVPSVKSRKLNKQSRASNSQNSSMHN